MDCIIRGSGSVSVASLQAVASSNSDRTGCIAAYISCWMISFNSDRNAQTVDLISAWADLMSSFRSFKFAFIIPFSYSRSLSLLACNFASISSLLAFSLASAVSYSLSFDYSQTSITLRTTCNTSEQDQQGQ
jgi:hypothetical protein